MKFQSYEADPKQGKVRGLALRKIITKIRLNTSVGLLLYLRVFNLKNVSGTHILKLCSAVTRAGKLSERANVFKLSQAQPQGERNLAPKLTDKTSNLATIKIFEI